MICVKKKPESIVTLPTPGSTYSFTPVPSGCGRRGEKHFQDKRNSRTDLLEEGTFLVIKVETVRKRCPKGCKVSPADKVWFITVKGKVPCVSQAHCGIRSEDPVLCRHVPHGTSLPFSSVTQAPATQVSWHRACLSLVLAHKVGEKSEYFNRVVFGCPLL